jgi:2-phospho-L-lactate/phosphoenolpyruvate guanylyltransferase
VKALLIPVKDPANAKTRLSRILTQAQRSALAWAMFEDVSRAVSSAENPDRVFLASSFGPAIAFAKDQGWDVLLEESQESESASVDRASKILSQRGFEIVMRLPADIPLVKASDIDSLLSFQLNPPQTVLVPSRDGTGTNAIIRTPATIFPSRFGPDSLKLHLEEARQSGTEYRIVANERIALDIDEPEDLDLLLKVGPPTSTLRVLKEIDSVGINSR